MAASVDACGYGTYLRKAFRIAIAAAEDEIACNCDDEHRQQTRQEHLEGLANLPVVHIASHKHQRDGQRHSQVAEEGVGGCVEREDAVVGRQQVGDGETYEVEHRHRADFLYPVPAFGQLHYQQRDTQQVDY